MTFFEPNLDTRRFPTIVRKPRNTIWGLPNK